MILFIGLLLDPDTAILIPETRPPYVSDGINKTNNHQYIELGNGNVAICLGHSQARLNFNQ